MWATSGTNSIKTTFCINSFLLILNKDICAKFDSNYETITLLTSLTIIIEKYT